MQMKESGKKYLKHISSDLHQIVDDFKNNRSKENRYMYINLYPFISTLQKKGINQLEDYSMIFKECGLTRQSRSEMIVFLLNHHSQNQINERTKKKLNCSYQNVIFNYLFISNQNEIINSIDKFITNYCSYINKHDNLIRKLQNKVSNDTFLSVSDDELNDYDYTNENEIQEEILYFREYSNAY